MPRCRLSPRRAVILVTVLLMLTLFMVVALSFVLYADTTAQAARLARQAEDATRADAEPELLLSYFLNKLIYDAADDETGIYCALRGHSLGRTMYGSGAANVVAFNGVGRLEGPSPFGPSLSDSRLLNYTFYPYDPQLPAAARFLRDPERLGWRSGLRAARGPFTGGANIPHTYPDLHNAFLAAVRADGVVLLPSYHRPWAAGAFGDFYDRTTGQLNPLWSTAPDALPPWFKYATLRPLPALNPGFPSPEDGGGDVKNLSDAPGTLRRVTEAGTEFWGNDSFWIDLGFPVLTAPNGTKYKPLFAPLIVDLDGRVNANVHGNAHGPGGAHASRQGWGPWEVSLERVLGGPNGGEARQLLLGSARPPHVGRYGGSPWANQPGTPAAPGAAADLPTPHVYGPADWLADATGHASLYNPFRPAGDDRRFAASNLEALLRYGETGSPMLTSELFRLAPRSFQDARARRLVTTHSADVDRPGAAPWLFDIAAAPLTVPPTVDPDQPGKPEGAAIPFPDPWARRTFSDNGEFGGLDWRSLAPALGRVDLSRPLPPYPHRGRGLTPPFGPPLGAADAPFTVDAPDGPIWRQFLAAQDARQHLANDFYRRLLALTGVAPVLPDENPQAPPPELLRVRRYLAQLATNIVDFVDDDDISTPFPFYTVEDYQGLAVVPPLPPDPARVAPGRVANAADGEVQYPLYWVFGTERPRLVLSEVMAQATRNDPDGAYDDRIRLFIELQATLPRVVPPGTDPRDALPLPLRMAGANVSYSPYRVVAGARSPLPFPLTAAAVVPGHDDDNPLGCPDLGVVRATTTDVDFAAVPPLPGLPDGYLLLGAPVIPPPPPREPPDQFALRDPFLSLTPVVRTPSLQYARRFGVRGRDDPPDERSHGVAVALRRLANPYLPFDGRRAGATGLTPSATYNPYVTIDFMEGIPLQPVEVVAVPSSVGKRQPFAAHRSRLSPQPEHTFGRANVPSEPWESLVHPDRILTSPLELLDVSGHPAYRLTQRFHTTDADGQVIRLGHRAPWVEELQDPSSPSRRLTRLWEFVTAGLPAPGVMPGGRSVGKVNVNTLWDPEILLALADPRPGDLFDEAGVVASFLARFYDGRPGASADALRRTAAALPWEGDRPFASLGVGTSPPGDTQQPDSGPGATALRLLGSSDAEAALLTKIAPHLTTRSNVFALWLTVGFFEVTDPTTRPPRLGAEIGKREGRNIRHRLFALLDRTNLSVASGVTALAETVRPAVPPQTVAVGALSGPTLLPLTETELSWSLGPGAVLVVDVGVHQEIVEVLSVDGSGPTPTLTARFLRPHAAGAPLALAQVPGAPPVFLRARSEPAAVSPPGRTFLELTVAVDVGRSGPSALAGVYDGVPWVLRPGMKVILDRGIPQEAATVEAVPFRIDAAAGTGTFVVAATRRHTGVVTVANTLLGNPGPQRRFDPRDPKATAIIRYFSVID